MNNLWAASFDAARFFPMKGICYFMVIMSVDYGDVRTGVAFLR
ncbi:MAG: RuvX/YqgF family protein [Anaerotruncus sp.]|nr:MAG: RuvX/YqgF family protein [Anaerotruncus sp.]